MMIFVASCAEITRTDKKCERDSRVAATKSKKRCRQKTHPEEEQPVKRFSAAKVLQGGALSTVEVCVSRKESPVELAHKSLEAVANPASQMDATVEVGVVDMTVPSNSSITNDLLDCTCNEPWNPFSSDLEDIDQGTNCNDSMLLKREISDSTVDRHVSFYVSGQFSDNSSTSQIMTSKSPEEECAKNPFNIDDAEAASTTSQLLEAVSKNYGAEEWANNPLTEDFAKAADVQHEEHILNEDVAEDFAKAADIQDEEHIPNEDVVVQPIGWTRTAKFFNQKNIGSVGSPPCELPASLTGVPE